MQPDESDDRHIDTEPRSACSTSGFETPPALVDDHDDEGGDPACWMGLIDDQRDHQ